MNITITAAPSPASQKFARFLHRVGEYLNYIAFFAVLLWIWFDDLLETYDRTLSGQVEDIVWRIVWTTLLVHFLHWLLGKMGYTKSVSDS